MRRVTRSRIDRFDPFPAFFGGCLVTGAVLSCAENKIGQNEMLNAVQPDVVTGGEVSDTDGERAFHIFRYPITTTTTTRATKPCLSAARTALSCSQHDW